MGTPHLDAPLAEILLPEVAEHEFLKCFPKCFSSVFGGVCAHQSQLFTSEGVSPTSGTRSETSGCGDCGGCEGRQRSTRLWWERSCNLHDEIAL